GPREWWGGQGGASGGAGQSGGGGGPPARCGGGPRPPGPGGGPPWGGRWGPRHATATLHWPVATAMAAWPTVPHPAPPPYPTSEKNVMSPRPTLRATSTSRPSSIENIASPSTSAGPIPPSSRAAEIAWHARDRSQSGSP